MVVLGDMTNYLPHYTKKKQILARKELALRRLIRSHAPRETLLAAADEVRAGRVRVLRAQRATIVPKDNARESYARIDARIQAIEATSATAILLEFGGAIEENQREV